MNDLNIMSEMPLVSICTPCYNHEQYLSDYLKSLLNQTYQRIELIIIDDQSTDRSVEIIQSYMPKLKERFERVYFEVNEHNLGITKNCNKILSKMRGDYYKGLASDDLLREDAIEKMVDYLESHPEVSVCISNGYEVLDKYKYASSLFGSKKIYTKNIEEFLTDNTKKMKKLLNANFICAPTVMLRSNLFSIYGYFDEKIKFEDYEYWLRIGDTEQFGYLDEYLVFYRVSQTSISHYKRGKPIKAKVEFMIIGDMQTRLKYIYKLEGNRKNLYSQIYNDGIEKSLESLCPSIAIKIYNTAKRKNIKTKYDMKKIMIIYIQNLLSLDKK